MSMMLQTLSWTFKVCFLLRFFAWSESLMFFTGFKASLSKGKLGKISVFFSRPFPPRRGSNTSKGYCYCMVAGTTEELVCSRCSRHSAFWAKGPLSMEIGGSKWMAQIPFIGLYKALCRNPSFGVFWVRSGDTM